MVLNQEKPDGFAALGMLAKRYNPKTPSRILHALTQVLSPPTVKDVRQAPRMVEEWEAAKGKLKVEFGEELSEVVQIAILTGMLPSDLQDKVFEMECWRFEVPQGQGRDRGHNEQLGEGCWSRRPLILVKLEDL